MSKLNIKKSLLFFYGSFLLIINFVFAQTQNKPLGELNGLISSSNAIALNVVSFLNILALIFYMVLVSFYLVERQKGGGDGLEKLKNMLVWGAVAMFFLVAVWGWVYFLSTSLGIRVGGCVEAPAAPGRAVNSDCNPGGVRPPNASSTPEGPSVVRPSEAEGAPVIERSVPAEINTGNSGSIPFQCSQGTPVRSQGFTGPGQVLYCQGGGFNDLCKSTGGSSQGTCGAGYKCSAGPSLSGIGSGGNAQGTYGKCGY